VRIAVIGGGIVGSLIARELTRYESAVLLFEKEADIGWGVTKANSAIVHGGLHETPGTERARLCVEGNRLYEELSRDLDVPFKRVGAYVVALSHKELPLLQELYEQGLRNGVPGLEMHDRGTILTREPNLNPNAVAGLWSPSVGITEPWSLAIAAVENGMENGLALHVAEEVTSIEVADGRVQGIVTGEGEYELDAVVNAAGLFADRVAEMAGLLEPVLLPCRGEYLLLDKKVGNFISSALFPTPNKLSKGILVVPTIDGGILLGPTAQDLNREEKEANETTRHGIQEAIEGARRLVPQLDLSFVVKTFAGLRPETTDKKFVIGRTSIIGFFQAAGIRSPGLTAAPSIARFLVRGVIVGDLNLTGKRSFTSTHHKIRKILDLPVEERDRLIEADSRYGCIICQCNHVTEGEIVRAIHRGARNLDGVKFRTCAGFGRCQGGSCTDKILLILARELEISPDEVTLRGGDSTILGGKVRT